MRLSIQNSHPPQLNESKQTSSVRIYYLEEGMQKLTIERAKERLSLVDWVFAFTHGYRYEASKLKIGETKCFEPYMKECMLTKPCQVEVVKFNKPDRIALLFLFDTTKLDLLINIRQGKWNKLGLTMKSLCKEYPSLQIDPKELRKLLVRCRYYPNESIFAIDYTSNVCLICFTHDPRVHGSPFPWKLSYITDPQEMAETVFNLNLQQAECYF
jgi:hypothetical protein